MIKRIFIGLLFVSISQRMLISQEVQGSIYYVLGSYSMQIFNFEEALKNFELSIKYNEPKVKEATIEAGYCNKILGNYQRAIKLGKDALQYELTEMEKGRTYLLIGASYGFIEDYKSAFNYFDLMKQASEFYDNTR